jgi:propanol-preferring alcohol dehydrogenase
MVVPASYFVPVPNVDDEAVVGPVLCSGVTVYKALKESKARPGQWVALTGAGGGLGSIGIQYARAMGLRVIGIDGGEEKGKLVRSLGAEAYVDFQKENVTEAIQKITGGRGVKAAIQLAPAEKSYNEALNYIDYNGYLWCIGLMKPEEKLHVSPFQLIFKNIKVGGSLVGTRVDLIEALDFLGRNLVAPAVTTYPMEKIQDILQDMASHKIVGRAVIKLL